ncbi:MAG: hypothetical protein QNK30_00135 [Bacteroidales bacterium]|nr:hypothetical protein [Bacteroidales bacterium]
MEDSVGTIFYIVIMVVILGASLLKKRKRVRKPGTVAGSSGNAPKQKPTTGQKLESVFSEFLRDQFPDVNQEDEISEISEEEIITEPADKKYEKIIERDSDVPKEGISVFANDDPNTPIIETGLFKNLATSKYQIADEFNYSENEEGYIKENEIGKLVEEFDLRKAIIYSEILSPKYFKIQEREN